jgi:hypothetical protein
MIIAVVIGPVWITAYFKSRERAQLYETLRTAYERGQPPPPELIEKLTSSVSEARSPNSANRDLRRAVVLIAVGLGVAGLGAGLGFGLSFASHMAGAIVGGIVMGCGAIPGFIGVAYLLLWLASRGHRADA